LKKIDSDALGILTKALGLTGAGSPITELTDGVVDQSLDVVPIIRRGRTQEPSSGIYTAIMQNIHAVADTETTQVNPYAVGTGVIPPYPDPLPPQFDLWLLSATVRRQSGAATVQASLHIQYGSRQQGWGVTDAGVAVVESAPVPIAYWDALVSTQTTFALLNGANGPYAHRGIRIPRAPNLTLEFTTVASAAATFNCELVLGVFPVSLGQDGIV